MGVGYLLYEYRKNCSAALIFVEAVHRDQDSRVWPRRRATCRNRVSGRVEQGTILRSAHARSTSGRVCIPRCVVDAFISNVALQTAWLSTLHAVPHSRNRGRSRNLTVVLPKNFEWMSPEEGR